MKQRIFIAFFLFVPCFSQSCVYIDGILVTYALEVEVEVTLRLTVSQPVCLGIEYPCGTCDQILFPVGMLLSEICGLVSVRRPL
jgi:hypothetical protein